MDNGFEIKDKRYKKMVKFNSLSLKKNEENCSYRIKLTFFFRTHTHIHTYIHTSFPYIQNIHFIHTHTHTHTYTQTDLHTYIHYITSTFLPKHNNF